MPTADPATFRIRPAAPTDAERLAAFARRVFHESFAADNRPEDMAAYLDATFSPERQAAELRAAGAATLLAETDDGDGVALAGYAQLLAGEAPACVAGPVPVELRRFYVDRRWHGGGLAARLMAAALDAAAALGGRTLWLGVWERNPRAIAFYGKHGFRDVGAQRFVLGADMQTDRVMARAIEDAGGVPPQ